MNVPHFLGIVQARSCSSRYKQKSLLKLGQFTILEYIAKRLQLIKNNAFSFLFAIGKKEHDTITQHLCSKHLQYIIGDENNVLERYIKTVESFPECDYIIRITADSPFIDINALENVIQIISSQSIQYLHTPSLLLGTGFECISKKTLIKQIDYNLLPHHREHVTGFIRENPEIFQITSYPDKPQIISTQEKSIRLTLDVPTDYEVIRNVFYELQHKIDISSEEILQLFKNKPSLFKANQNVIQNESYLHE